MNSLNKFKQPYCVLLSVLTLLVSAAGAPPVAAEMGAGGSGYVARQEGVKGLFDALSSAMGRPVILSKLAAGKKLSGQFDLADPKATLTDIAGQLGLIWYDDGQAVYIYDSVEMRNTIITLRSTTFASLTQFLKQSGLYDARYPLRSDNRASTFYLSGPPIYVDTVTSTAQFLDEKKTGSLGSTNENIAVVPLYNTFVTDRRYKYRSEDIVIPGVSTVINQLLDGLSTSNSNIEIQTAAPTSTPEMPAFPGTRKEEIAKPVSLEEALNKRQSNVGLGLRVIPNPGNNSLMVRGSAEQIDYVRDLVGVLDQPKRHIELSVWIVDLQKDALDQLGIRWEGQVNVSGKFGVSLNGGSSTVDGASFMAAALALSRDNKANIVSRPMILTQENIPAIFDNNRTFYTRLIGERTADLKDVTYGTLVSVLPRFTASNEIEMMLNVEDGNQTSSAENSTESLPEVGRTNISTVARVPRGKSLLIGGYTRDENSDTEAKIPGLGSLPLVGGLFRYSQRRSANMVRVFLIQPREIDSPLSPDADQFVREMKADFSSDKLQDWMSNYIDNRHGIDNP